MMKHDWDIYLLENLIKNIVVIVVLFLCFGPIKASIAVVRTETFGIILTVVGSIVLAALFGCFSFTYEKSVIHNKWDRYLGHLTIGLMMFVVGLSFIIILAIFERAVPNLTGIFSVLTAITFLSVIGYDFWDLRRAHFQ